eukprot:7193562-Pyramimonas_sp.AAC.1
MAASANSIRESDTLKLQRDTYIRHLSSVNSGRMGTAEENAVDDCADLLAKLGSTPTEAQISDLLTQYCGDGVSDKSASRLLSNMQKARVPSKAMEQVFE